MSDQTKQLQESVILLKARMFDIQEQAASDKATCDEFATALTEIAKAIGISGETIQLADIVDAVKALVPVQEDLPLDEAE